MQKRKVIIWLFGTHTHESIQPQLVHNTPATSSLQMTFLRLLGHLLTRTRDCAQFGTGSTNCKINANTPDYTISLTTRTELKM